MDIPRGKPRRPHQKSRTGCRNCKERKVKCDETKPVCQKCQNYKDNCSFLQTHPIRPPVAQLIRSSSERARGPTIQSMLSPDLSASSTPHSIPYSPTPTNFSMLDMELLHFYTIVSVKEVYSLPDIVSIFRTAVVQLAFEYTFLMHEILSITALHLAHLRPERRSFYLHTSDVHSSTGIALAQTHLDNLTPENCHACFAFSTLTFTHAWAAQEVTKPSAMFFKATDDEDTIQWVKFQRGTNEILKSVYPLLVEGPLGGLISKWVGLDEHREDPDPLPNEEYEELRKLPEAWKYSQLPEEQFEALDGAFNKVKRVFSMLEHNRNIGGLPIVLAWLSWISAIFLEMLEQKIPEALLIVASWCVALKRVERVWWMEGKAENLYNTLVAQLPVSVRLERLKWTDGKMGLS